MQATCETFSISFDGWGANNHIHILAAIAHWITQEWERRSVVIEFAEMTEGKSGEAMANILWETLGPDYKTSVETISENIITTVTEERQGLNCAQKLFAVCGDNASNNDTFCDHFHSLLLGTFENDPSSDSDVERCRFRGRSSRIRCIAHIISLIVDAIFATLRSGSYAQAKELVDNTGSGSFAQETCASLSIYMKIRTFVLWIQRSDDRRSSWRKFCTIMIPLDVETRWNALYLMMFKARANKGAIGRFARAHPEVQHLVPSDDEWTTCEVMERCLEPFYDWTRAVSRDKPSLPDAIGIMWGLDDLLQDVKNQCGQFSNAGNDIRKAFDAGVEVIEDYQMLINDNIMYYAAHVLDPRVKFNLIDEQCDDPMQVKKDVRDFFKREWLTGQPPKRSVPAGEIKAPKGASQHSLNLLRRAKVSSDSGVCDIDRYLDAPAITWDDEDETNYDPDWILKWWKTSAGQFPYMAKAARALLAVPSAEVDVERLFSGGRDLLGIRRFGLNGESMRILTLLKAYFERLHASQDTEFCHVVQLPEVRLQLSLIGKYGLIFLCILAASRISRTAA